MLKTGAARETLLIFLESAKPQYTRTVKKFEVTKSVPRCYVNVSSQMLIMLHRNQYSVTMFHKDGLCRL